MPADRIYYNDAYATTFTGIVTAVDGDRVRLDQSAFYPTSGGQQFDTGTLGGARVVDVVDDGGVVHVLASPPSFAVGATVTGAVDWPRRFDHMQQHTGQHLLSALFEDMARAPTVSVHFGDESCTLDVDALVSRDAAVKVEARANAVIAENRSVTVSFEDAATAAGLRKASDRSGELRIVTIDGIDRSACGGTHVRATGEIGAVLVRRLEKYKSLTRIEFLCGARAVARARADYEALTGMAAALTAGIDELPKLVASNAESLRELESQRKKLVESLAGYRAAELYAGAASGADGNRRVVTTGAPDELRALSHAVAAMERVVFVGTCDAPPSVVFAASPDSGVNAGAVLKAALAAHGGRGGGNPKVAQGTAPTLDALRAVAAALTP
jgi:alanyl-tRNA synthetase